MVFLSGVFWRPFAKRSVLDEQMSKLRKITVIKVLQLVLRYLGDWFEQIDGYELIQMSPCSGERKSRHEDRGSIFKQNHVREVQLQHNCICSHLQTSDHLCHCSRSSPSCGH